MLEGFVFLWQEGSGVEVIPPMSVGGGHVVRYSGGRSTTSATANVGNNVPCTSRSAVIARLDIAVRRQGGGSCGDDGGCNDGMSLRWGLPVQALDDTMGVGRGGRRTW